MTTASFPIRQLFPITIAAALALQPITLAAAEPALRIIDEPGEQRMVLTLGPIGPASHGATAAAAMRAAAGRRIGRAVIVHGFAIDLVDGSGETVAGMGQWEAALLIGRAAERDGRGLQPLVRLSREVAATVLPKPLGYRIEAGDSIVVVAELSDAAVHADMALYLRLTLAYESLDGPVSRLAVVPQAGRPADASAIGAGRMASRSWELTADVSGRVMAITGRALEAARELVLEDDASGEVLWRASVPAIEPGPSFVRPAAFIRLGVAVHDGRVYRLTAIYDAASSGAAAQPMSQSDVQVMVLPSRAGDRLAAREAR